MFAIFDAACAAMRDMGTFAQAGIGDDFVEELMKNNQNSLSRN